MATIREVKKELHRREWAGVAVTINRKNFLFSDTEKGADASAAVMSIIETAKRSKLASSDRSARMGQKSDR